MNFVLKNVNKYNTIVVLLGIFSTVAGVASAFFSHVGIAIMPITGGLLAALITVEGCGKRIWSYIVPFLIIVPDVIINSYYSFNGALSVVIALLIFLFFRKGYSKTTLAVIVTALVTGAICAYFVFGAFLATGKDSLEAVTGYYAQLIEQVRALFMEYVGKLKIDGITTDTANTLFNATLLRCFAIPIILAFAVSGVAIKTFFAIIICNEKEPSRFYNWRFGTTTVFAIVFGISSVINWFTSASDSVFAAVVGNLYLIFLAVYAYLGFTFIRAVFARKFNVFLSNFLPILIIIVFNALAVQIFSFLGMIMTVMGNRMINSQMNDNNSDDRSE